MSFFLLFMYASYALLVSYCILFVYVLIESFNSSTYLGDQIRSIVLVAILQFITIPVVLFSLAWLIYFIRKSDIFGYIIAGLAIMLPVLLMLNFFLQALHNGHFFKTEANKIADTALQEALGDVTEGASYKLEKYYTYESGFDSDDSFLIGTPLYHVFTYSLGSDYSQGEDLAIEITVNGKTEEVAVVKKAEIPKAQAAD